MHGVDILMRAVHWLLKQLHGLQQLQTPPTTPGVMLEQLQSTASCTAATHLIIVAKGVHDGFGSKQCRKGSKQFSESWCVAARERR
jgi:hypothetical protein